jgi:VanZ family protein
MILGIMNGIAMHFSFYWIFPWFDSAMHTFGGFALAFIVATFPPLYKHISKLSWQHMWYIIAYVLILGFLWELFEFTLDEFLQVRLQDNIQDTISDLCWDMLGAFIGYLVIRYEIIKKLI